MEPATLVRRTDDLALITAGPALRQIDGSARPLRAVGELAGDALMVAHGSFLAGSSFVVRRDAIRQERLASLTERGATLDIREPVSIVSVESETMRGRSGVAGLVFGAVAQAGVSILAIAQGADERTISLCVHGSDATAVEQALRQTFGKPSRLGSRG